MKPLDTSYHKRRLKKLLRDPEFRAEYERVSEQLGNKMGTNPEGESAES